VLTTFITHGRTDARKTGEHKAFGG